MKNKEIRSIILGSGNGRTIEGMIPYNSASEPLPWTEYLQRGCFSKTLKESKNIRALYAHDESQILASTKNGSLKFEDREDGLHFSFELPNTRLGDDTLELVRTGLVDGCSFGMIVTKDEWTPRRDKRTIKELRLFEVSLCPQNQAYSGSSVVCRSLSEALKDTELSEENIEEIKKEIEQLSNLLPKEDTTEDIEEVKAEEETPVAESEVKEEPVVEETAPPEAEPTVLKSQYDSLLDEYNKAIEDFTKELEALKEAI